LTPSEWLIIISLKQILKQFAIASQQLQDNPSFRHNRSAVSRFNEYLPVVEFLLDHLETAVTGWIINVSEDPSAQRFKQINIFGD
jgi:hypothetical protein